MITTKIRSRSILLLLLLIITLLCLCLLPSLQGATTTDERCKPSGTCVRCTPSEKSGVSCIDNGYHQRVECYQLVSGGVVSKNMTRQYYQSCEPEIFYSDQSTRVFVIFEVSLLVVVVSVGFFFYRRKRHLFNEAQQRYTRLTSGRQD